MQGIRQAPSRAAVSIPAPSPRRRGLWRHGATLAVAVIATGCGGPPQAPPFEIVWGGDVLLGDAAQPHLEERGLRWPFERIANLLAADYLVANAEGPITSVDDPFFPDQEFSYNAEPAVAEALAEVGFDALGLSNNHALDRGPEGLGDTLQHLTDAEIEVFGAGTLLDAQAPLMVDTPHGVVAILGFGEAWRYGSAAGSDELGTVAITQESVAHGHRLARDAGANWVVGFVHWGENYADVTDDQRSAAQLFADAGYDLVIGHHPHIVQEVEILDGTPVLYSLGNLAFGTPGRFRADAEGYGLIARTSFEANGRMEIRLACIVTDNEIVEFQPEPCATAEARRLFARLGSAVLIEGRTALIDPAP